METSLPPGSHSCKPVRDLAEATKLLCDLATKPELQTLQRALQPAQLFLVGGTVRDAFLVAGSTDLDLATNLTATDVRRRCVEHGLRVIDTGIQHGTVLVVINGVHFEVTTFRTPSDRNTQITAADIKTDLSGRDFTINALAFCLSSLTILDPFGGVADLTSTTLRAVQDPHARLSEDPLRILRMIRFGDAQGRTIEATTLEAARSLIPTLARVSVERIRSELEHILMSAKPDAGVRCMQQLGALPYTLPELIPAVGFEQNRYHIHDVFEHTLSVLSRTPPDRILRWSAIFHDVGKPHTLSVDTNGERHFYSHEVVSDKLCLERMTHLRFSHDDISKVRSIVRHHMRPLDCGPAGVRRLIRDLGENLSPWRRFKEADSSPTIPIEEFHASASAFDALLATEHRKMAAPSYGRLAISGEDLKTVGVTPGPAMGKLLKELEELVIDDPSKNDREVLLTLARARADQSTLSQPQKGKKSG
jgi:tRNA nucleotidyltransferase (CCA-adding enzyme)